MKISPKDKLQALKRSKLYAKDFKRLIENIGEEYHILHGSIQALPVKLSPPEKKFCKRWNIRFPISPDTPVTEIEIFLVYPIVSFLDPPKSWRSKKIEYIAWTDDPEGKVLTHVNGKMVLMVDTDFPRDQIKKAFELFLGYYGKPTKGRVREGMVDIWEVYDMREKEGKNYSEIGRILSGLQDYSADDNQVKAAYRRAKRAYEKACRIIKFLEEAAVAHDH